MTTSFSKLNVMLLPASAMLAILLKKFVPVLELRLKELTFAVPGKGSPSNVVSLAIPSASIKSTPIAFGLLFGSLFSHLVAS